MTLQDEMFRLVENWKESKLPKTTFINGKDISKDKFNYWVHKYNKQKGKLSEVKKPDRKPLNKAVFKEFIIPEIKQLPIDMQKVIELTTPSGIQIRVFS